MSDVMTPMARVSAVLSGKQPDRVPYFLPLSYRGAHEVGQPIREYFASPENVVEAQVRMRARFGHDLAYSFSHASVEVEAFGGETVFYDDAAPNAGAPPVRRLDDVMRLEPPRIEDSPGLRRVLSTTTLLRERLGPDVPIVGVVVSPFSLPVMQLGFAAYIDLLYLRSELLTYLLTVNEAFTLAWARAQLRAGATALAYFDPLASPSMVPPEVFLKSGLPVAKRIIGAIGAPIVYHFASGRCLPVLDEIVGSGAAMVTAGAQDDLRSVKSVAGSKLTVLGDLNAIEMRNWSARDAEERVKSAIAKAGRGGRFILTDQHGEIPWQVPDDVLSAVSSAVRKWGTYPLDWAASDAS